MTNESIHLTVRCVFIKLFIAAKSLQSCPTVLPHRQPPTRLRCPWDSPGKNTGVGCHFLLQCMKVNSESEVAQSRLTLSDPMDCSLPGSSIHGIFQARVLEWGATAPRSTKPSCWPPAEPQVALQAGTVIGPLPVSLTSFRPMTML